MLVFLIEQFNDALFIGKHLKKINFFINKL